MASGAAFSLIEIVIAVGIISFALVGILGLFPAAINSATDSQRETQAALIAHRIFSDLGTQAPFQQTKDDLTKPDSVATVNLATTTKKTYTAEYDEGGMLPGHASGTGAKTTGAPVYYVETIVEPSTQSPNLARVEIDVSAPASAPAARRKTFVFVTLLNAEPLALTATP
ncbi:MAG: type II secretion system protein [Terrimicrobiaceae bacterium]|nr:type II secretion system protein [Terrimicrobiaceae bacterium]